MSGNELEFFANNLRIACLTGTESDVERSSFESNFTEEILAYLNEFGVVEDCEKNYFRQRGIKVNGYGISDERDRLFLFTSIPMSESEAPLTSISKTQLDQAFARAVTFFNKCLQGLPEDIDEADPAWEMINDIRDLGRDLSEMHIYALAGGTTRQFEYTSTSIGTIRVIYHIWTLDRLHRLCSSGKAREIIDVDFNERFGQAIPCLEAPHALPEIHTYMLVFNGDVLADIYNEYRERLLQKNVRCFLQLKGKVNKGLRTTIHDQPEYFMAYNNGLTMTAEDVTVTRQDGALFLSRAVDLQIVNGGQTTASIWSAKYKDKVDVSKVGVQVKLTSMSHSAKMDDLVSDISRYANTQNKVSESDFSSNHPFHRKLEELSRTTWAPSKGDSQVETKWFYERSRGQYMGERSRQGISNSAAVKKWDAAHPRNQMFSKTDLAKYENTWRQLPHMVSLGAQKNFIAFMNDLKKSGSSNPDDSYFMQLAAKAILFKTAEKIVGKQKFGGYRAQIVTYTLAKLSNASGQLIDLDAIWAAQEVSQLLCNAIESTSVYANQLIQHEMPSHVRNSGEWAKKDLCWKKFLELDVQLSPDFKNVFRQNGKRIISQEILRDPVTPDEQAVISWLKETSTDLWQQLFDWSKETGNFPGRNRNMFLSMKQGVAKKVWDPSAKQAKFAKDLYAQAVALGFCVGSVVNVE